MSELGLGDSGRDVDGAFGSLPAPHSNAAGSGWGHVGIGLPSSLPGCPGDLLVDWASAAEQRGFGSLATIDRLAYPTYDPLVALAAAGAVTERIGLLANVIVGPTRNPTLLAKESATVQALSGGRFVLGLGVGDRHDDFALAGASFSSRGDALDALVDALGAAWAGEPPPGTDRAVVPVPVRVPLLLGGHADRSIARAVRSADGWTVGGLSPTDAAPLVGRFRAAWEHACRGPGPLVVALAYFVLGDDCVDAGANALVDYYSWYGSRSDEEKIVEDLLTTPDAVRDRVAAFRTIGVDHVVLYPTFADVSQVHRLADALLAGGQLG